MSALYKALRLREPQLGTSNIIHPVSHFTEEGVPLCLASQYDRIRNTHCAYLLDANRTLGQLTGLQQQQPLYEALDSKDAFRFLFLHLEEDLDEQQQQQQERTIVCSLFQHKLDEDFKYTALSYEWGTPAVNGQTVFPSSAAAAHGVCGSHVTVNGHQIAISANLFDALLHIRARLSKGVAAVLWIDALCINQDDMLERGHQVAQMRKIYHNAQKVLCWLGPATEETHSLDKKLFSLDVMQRSYWQRAWIIQEVVLARSIELMCGKLCFSLEDIEDNRHKEVEGFPPTPTGFYRLRDLRTRFLLSSQQSGVHDAPLSLLDAIQLSGRSRATDSRDLVYAVLSLVSDKEVLDLLQPDYALSPCQVFCCALSILSKTTKNSRQYIASLKQERHYSTYGDDEGDEYADTRKSCHGKRGCQTLMKMQLWSDDDQSDRLINVLDS